MTTVEMAPASTEADAAVARARPIPAEKKLGSNYPPCPHCDNHRMVFHCNDKAQCTWLRCVDCNAIIEPSDWSHTHAEHVAPTRRATRCAA